MTSRLSNPVLGLLVLNWIYGCSGPSSNPNGDAQNQTTDGSVANRDAAHGDVVHADNTVVQLGDVGETGLPDLPTLLGVQATVNGDGVEVRFHPVDGARDYRVYALPAPGDIVLGSDGTVTIHNAIYRCAGTRQATVVGADAQPDPPGAETHTVVNGTVLGFSRTMTDATLGYVFVASGAGRSPVYVLGDPANGSDTSYYGERWNESRRKRYVSSDSVRQTLLSQGWRDDGIAFWVPTTASADTKVVYTQIVAGDNSRAIYYVDGTEATMRANDTHAMADWQVLRAGQSETVPLMRVFYTSNSHDELVAGAERFQRAYHQGNGPLWSLHWSGLTASTTLVVEALDAGCPFQGLESPVSIPANAHHQAYVTLDQMRAASSSGEVYLNGQSESTNRPHAIARSFVQVSPATSSGWDWFDGFTTLAPFSDGPCGQMNPDGSENCFAAHRQISSDYDVSWTMVEPEQWGLGSFLGEFRVAYADNAADTNGKFRLTPLHHATMSAASYLHVTMEVDSVSTQRRYPQILISDREPPIQYHLEEGRTLVLETIGNWPYSYQLQVCDHRTWDVNNQCPAYALSRHYGSNDTFPPNAEVAEHAGVDRSARFDIYASTSRAYLLLDGEPYGCADLPSGGAPSGSVTVTFGDVLYHSAVDEPIVNDVFQFNHDHQFVETKRHFDNLGFASAVAAPEWNESVLPCRAASDIGNP